jgi:hypothetical protein
MKKEMVLSTSQEVVIALESPPLGETREEVEAEADTTKLCSKEFGPVMETQIAAVDREKQRALEQKAKDVANKD